MDTKGTIACIITSGFEDSEFGIPRKRLEDAGFDVELIGLKPKQRIRGKHGKQKPQIRKSIDDADVNAYAGLFIPGGTSPDQLRADERFVRFVKDFDATHKVIAAVCHGPQLLLTANLVSGRTLTAWSTVQGDLQKAGAIVKDEEVVVDGNWVTSRKPEDLEAFSSKFIEELGRASGMAASSESTQHDPHPANGLAQDQSANLASAPH